MLPTRIEPLDDGRVRAWFGERFVEVTLSNERNYAGAQPETFLGVYLDALRCLPERPARVLDVGCGSGYGADALVAAGYSVVGVDPSEEAVRFARLRAPGAWCAQGSMTAVPAYVGCESVHAVVSVESLEHVQDDRAALLAIRTTLVPDGLLYISTPDVELAPETIDNEFHVRGYSLASLTALLAECGFTQVGRRVPPPGFEIALIVTCRRTP